MQEFSAFFEANYSFVVGVAERRLSSLQDAEDAATAAFEIAWKHYRAGEDLSVPWLYGVVKNLVGDEYRRRERSGEMQRRLNDSFSDGIPFGDELRADVRDAIERLPEVHREVLTMAYWDRLTAREMAAVLDINSTAVRARLMRARRLLNSTLSDPQIHIDKEEVSPRE